MTPGRPQPPGTPATGAPAVGSPAARLAPHRRGFALVLTLALLALAAVTLAQVGRQSLAEISHALDAETKLQRDWAFTSVERTLLSRAESLLATAEPDAIPFHGAGVVRYELELGELRLHLRLADEHAKVPLPTLVDALDREPAQRQLQPLLRNTSTGAGLVVRLQPLPGGGGGSGGGGGGEARWGIFESFDQVLRPRDATALTATHLVGDTHFDHRPAVIDTISPWSDAPVHWRRASRDVLETVLTPRLSPGLVHRLVELRREDPEQGLSRILDELDLTEAERTHADTWIGNETGTYSLWVTITRTDETRHASPHQPRPRDHHRMVIQNTEDQYRQVLHW